MVTVLESAKKAYAAFISAHLPGLKGKKHALWKREMEEEILRKDFGGIIVEGVKKFGFKEEEEL